MTQDHLEAKETLDKIIAVLITVPTEIIAQEIANSLLDSRLAACISYIPSVKSIYRWKGQIERSDEFLIIAKTRSSLFEELKTTAKKIHPYELPEIIAMEISHGLDGYLQWVLAETLPNH